VVRKKVKGPDGLREVDVQIRDIANGRERFILLECKDLKRPVDVVAIGELNDLSVDLKPDLAIIYSNSGFTAQALRKANRQGIGAMSALRAGNKRIRCVVDRLVVAKRLSVDTYTLNVFPDETSNLNFPETWSPTELLYERLPVLNWASEISRVVIHEYEGAREIVCRFQFSVDTPFLLAGGAVTLRGFDLKLWCSRTWLSQVVRTDVTAGAFDVIRNRVMIAEGQALTLGWFDKDKWEPCDIPLEEQCELETGEMDLQFTLLNPIPPIDPKGTPDITTLLQPIVEIVVDGSGIRRPLIDITEQIGTASARLS